MNEKTKKAAIQLFEDLTTGYKSRSSRVDSRIRFHIRLEKIEGLMPHDVQFMHNTQSDFCNEYTRLKHILSRPKVRRRTIECVKNHFDNRNLKASFKPEKKSPRDIKISNQLNRNLSLSLDQKKAIT